MDVEEVREKAETLLEADQSFGTLEQEEEMNLGQKRTKIYPRNFRKESVVFPKWKVATSGKLKIVCLVPLTLNTMASRD